MGALQPLHLIVVLAIVVLLFGAQRIPALMSGMGRGIKEFKQATKDDEDAGAPASAQIKTDNSTRRDVV